MPGWENKKPKFPAVVVFSEIYNVTEPIRRFCRMVAGRGFLVAAPEIFHDVGVDFAYSVHCTYELTHFPV